MRATSGCHAKDADDRAGQEQADQRQRHREQHAPQQRLARQAAGAIQLAGPDRLRDQDRAADRERGQRRQHKEHDLQGAADTGDRSYAQPRLPAAYRRCRARFPSTFWPITGQAMRSTRRRSTAGIRAQPADSNPRCRLLCFGEHYLSFIENPNGWQPPLYQARSALVRLVL